MRIPVLFGVVNVTPDSFSDGGRYFSAQSAIDHGLRLLDEGADVLDVGGESTRPGADPVLEAEELARVLPVVAGLLLIRPDAVISVDTQKSAVARASIDRGARMINDISGLSDPNMAPICGAAGVELAIMHSRGTPKTMQAQTVYGDLVKEVDEFLVARIAEAQVAGVPLSKLWIDPGLGFAKAPLDNPTLIRAIPRFAASGARVLIGASRKRFVGELSGEKDPERRIFGSIGAALAAASAGAHGLRVHDVAATRQALAVYAAIRGEG